MEPGLYLVATPIGNLDDITIRALEVLKNSDIILCEHTRRSIKLLSHYKIKKKLISYHKFNEQKQLANIIKYSKEGKILSLVSDAGTPLLSDPGRILVNECVKNGIKVTPIPGVSSITASLSVSGFKDQFLFYGFLPNKTAARQKILEGLVTQPHTLIFYEAARRLQDCMQDIVKVCGGDRQVVLARELTKMHEEFVRCSAAEMLTKLQEGEITLKGECVLLLAGAKVTSDSEKAELELEKVLQLLLEFQPSLHFQEHL